MLALPLAHTHTHLHRHNGQSGKIIPFVVRVLARPRRLRYCCSSETLAVVVVAGNNNNELRNAVVSLLSSGYRIGNFAVCYR